MARRSSTGASARDPRRASSPPTRPALLPVLLAVALAALLAGCSSSSSGSPASALTPAKNTQAAQSGGGSSQSGQSDEPGQSGQSGKDAGDETGDETRGTVTKLLVFVVENHSLDQMRDEMPYTFGLAEKYAYASSYTAITHPSLPDYLAITGGQTFEVQNDDGPDANPVGGTSVFGQALAEGRSAMLYAEGMPTNCALENGGDNYAVKHNPWAYYVVERSACEKYDVPIDRLSDDITAGRLTFQGPLIPDLCNDAHNCKLAIADRWLEDWMTRILDGPDWRSGHLAVVITADEDDRSQGNRVLTVVVHPSQHGKVVDTPLTHYSLTRLYEDVLGAPYLFEAASAPSMTDAFGLEVAK